MLPVLPSEVVETIRCLYSDLDSASIREFPVGNQHAPQLSLIHSLVGAIPDEVLVLEPRGRIEYLVAVHAIKNKLDRWLHASDPEPLKKASGLHAHPLLVIRDTLAKCPDEIPRAAVSDLLFVKDDELRASLRHDLGSIEVLLHTRQWKAATVLAGSVLETLLFSALRERPQEDVAKAASDRKLKLSVDRIDRWYLSEFIDTAEELGLIGKESATQSRLANEFRNLIHPGRVQRLKDKCSRATTLSAISAVERAIEDLGTMLHRDGKA